MTLWLFAFVVLPIVVVAMGYCAMLINERGTSIRRTGQ